MFEFVPSVVTSYIVKQSPNMKPTPRPPEAILALTLYSLALGYSSPTVGALFGVSESLASITFNNVVHILVVTM